MMNYYGYGMHPGFGFSGFFDLFWFVLILWLFVAIFRRLFNHLPPKDSGLDNVPLEILKKRYAQGDITKKEFLEMKKDIS